MSTTDIFILIIIILFVGLFFGYILGEQNGRDQ